jgi:hypothetical protein
LPQGRAEAPKTLDAQIRYGMTAEWVMQERYADNDPSFRPWQPNASANGRLLMMLMDFCGEAPTAVRTPIAASQPPDTQGATR